MDDIGCLKLWRLTINVGNTTHQITQYSNSYEFLCCGMVYMVGSFRRNIIVAPNTYHLIVVIVLTDKSKSVRVNGA